MAARVHRHEHRLCRDTSMCVRMRAPTQAQARAQAQARRKRTGPSPNHPALAASEQV
jgi:hypothetical protein